MDGGSIGFRFFLGKMEIEVVIVGSGGDGSVDNDGVGDGGCGSVGGGGVDCGGPGGGVGVGFDRIGVV